MSAILFVRRSSVDEAGDWVCFVSPSRDFGGGELVYAASCVSRKDIRSRRAWLGPLAIVNIAPPKSFIFELTYYTPQSQMAVECTALSRLRSLRKPEEFQGQILYSRSLMSR
jgi:hypothetical protein